MNAFPRNTSHLVIMNGIVSGSTSAGTYEHKNSVDVDADGTPELQQHAIRKIQVGDDHAPQTLTTVKTLNDGTVNKTIMKMQYLTQSGSHSAKFDDASIFIGQL